jgi:hypothetical protein
MVLEFMPNQLFGWAVPPLTDNLPESIRLAVTMTVEAPAKIAHAGTVITVQVPVTFGISHSHGIQMTPPPRIPSHKIPYPREISSNVPLVWSLPSGWGSPEFPLTVDAVRIDQDDNGQQQEQPSLTMAVSQCRLDVAHLPNAVEGGLTLLDGFRVQTNAYYWTLDRLFGNASCNSSNLLCQTIKNEGAWAVFAHAVGAGARRSAVSVTSPVPF